MMALLCSSVAEVRFHSQFDSFFDYKSRARIGANRATSMSTRPLLSMTLAGTIGFAGDAVVQRVERPTSSWDDFDWGRSARMACFRIPQAPFVELVWRRFDAAALALKLSGPRAIAFKVACDQTLLLPSLTVVFFVVQGLLEGNSVRASLERARVEFWPTVQAGVPFWTTVHVGTFGFIPANYRIPYTSLASVMWTSIISHKNQACRNRLQL